MTTTQNGLVRQTFDALLQRPRLAEAVSLHRHQRRTEELLLPDEAVEYYAIYLELLRSVHLKRSLTIDWQSLAGEPELFVPQRSHFAEMAARERLKHYRPSLLDKVLARSKKKTAALQAAVTAAKEEDEAIFKQLNEEFEKDREAFKVMQDIAKLVLAKNTAGYREAIGYFEPFPAIVAFDSRLRYELAEDYAVMHLQLQPKEVVPDYFFAQEPNGKLSKKSMPLSRFNELYRDHVCSCVLHIADQTLAHLPVKFVIVHTSAPLLNNSTGDDERHTILSVVVFPSMLQDLNVNSVDPFAFIQQCTHHMNFFKAAGFMPVEKLKEERFL